MINTKTNAFIEAMVKLINESGLPPVNVRMALELIHAQTLEAEKAAMDEEKSKESGDAI